MLRPDQRFEADPNVLFTELGEEGVLLHLDTQYYFSLNETGLKIWQGINEGKTLAEVAEALCEDYEIDEAGAWEHVSSFAAHLKEMELLVDAPEAAGEAER